MKIINLIVALPTLLFGQIAYSQTSAPVQLSAQYPAAGEKITLVYQPSGTPLDGKSKIDAAVYFLDNKSFPVADVDLTADGGSLKGEFSVPEAAKAFFIKLSSGDTVDNNNDKGYVYLVYKNTQPVEGAYASEGNMLASGIGMSLAKIKRDQKTGFELFQKEFELYPQSAGEYQASYYMMMARNPDYKAAVLTEITQLEKSTDEKDLTLAANLLTQIKSTKSADSLKTILGAKYPNGNLVKNEMQTAFYRERGPEKKDSLYNVYMQKFPEESFVKDPTQDNMRIQLAGAYLDKGDLDNFGRYEKLVKNKSNLTLTYNDAAYEMAKKGENLAEAEKLAKESLKLINEQIKHPIAQAYRSPKQQKKDIEYTYDLIADTYAFVLYKENKFGEALNYEQPVYDHLTRIDADIYENYIQILNALGKYREAQPIAEKAIVAGKSSDAINTQLKDIYTKLKGSDAGYNDYLTALKNQSANNTKEELAKTMINQPAPAFTLKDVDGNTVSLADLKGKIVIVDFWATWCGPCKASFPGMQLAVNKYKDNPDIKFLFVDCWETDDNFLPGVKKFISDNKYTFHVLLDEKGSDGKQAKVLNAYEVQGIPTKFIIDKTGNIRFKYVGYSGTPEKLVDEVTTMIDIATNPGSITSAPAAAGTKTGTGK